MITTRNRWTTAVAAAAACAVLAACSSGGGGTGGGDADGEAGIGEAQSVGAMEEFEAGTTFRATEPLEFSLMYRDHPNYPVLGDWLAFSTLESEQNVTFSRTDVPLADWDQKKALLIGAGDAAELIPVTYPGQEVQFISGGAILPVSDYLEYMPNYTQKVEDWGLQDDIDAQLRQADGKYYLLPGLREIPDVQYSVVIREDLFANAGITEDPEDWEEFAEQLEQVKAANPGLSHAWSDRWTDSTPLGSALNVMAPTFGTSAGWGYENAWYDQEAEEFVLAGTTDAYRDLVTYAAGLVADGSLDPEVTQSDDQAIQKFVSGSSAAISGNTQELTSYRTKFADSGQADVPLRLIEIPDGPFGNYLSGSQLSSGLMISAKAAEQPHFKALLQFADWLYYSDEGIEFAQWGVEGETYTKDAEGVRTLEPTIGWNALNPDAPERLNADYGFSNGVFLLANGSTTDLLQSVMSEEIQTWTDEVLAGKETLPVSPSPQLEELELEQTSLLDTQIQDAVMAATAAFITGGRSLDTWDTYVSEIEGLGATQLIDTYNAALERQQG
ncbi:sugar ABC transporter substrate-binding protein [Serinibacter arcticus]|uniref:Sugar ABC transporter substrate-binding protein n=1 Tax=Serinibacter arcticus TaxID=1655435 RepID=A0A2U1ZWI7_9MICO|nr:extracellular solute-binding protein [Serinibacter arcticus]PWD51303.1 sugar ABC transporter substrate-binding protein [Serinibacter arcticus]